MGERVLIVDWDVHHGNGTQDIFWDDPAVLYVSTHQHPLYPGTGRPDEVGGPGAPGLTLNLPLPRGRPATWCGPRSTTWRAPTIEASRPDWVLVSCGFDAHRDDPLSNLQLSSGDFADWPASCASSRPGPGRLALFLEGGYDAGVRCASSVEATLGALLGPPRRAGPRRRQGGPGLAELRADGDGAADAPSTRRAMGAADPGGVSRRALSRGRGARARGSARWSRSTR